MKERAAKFLRQRMTPGQPFAAKELLDEAAAHGIGKDALHRAKDELGVIVGKADKVWSWTLPALEGLFSCQDRT